MSDGQEMDWRQRAPQGGLVIPGDRTVRVSATGGIWMAEAACGADVADIVLRGGTRAKSRSTAARHAVSGSSEKRSLFSERPPVHVTDAIIRRMRFHVSHELS